MSKKSKKSFEKVNYLFRLKKQIERKIIIETLQQLSKTIDVSNYHYLGLGSIYFADFILFHKYLNIKSMTSIEKEKDQKKRCIFNKPYEFVILEMSNSYDFLNKVDWEKNLFIWLDYDGEIDKSMLDDIQLVGSKSKPLDIFITTINAKAPPQPGEFIKKYELYMPTGIKKNNLTERNYPKILHHIVNQAILKGKKINVKSPSFLQLFNLTYEDTSKMYTFGGIFCEDENPIREKLSKLFYISHDDTIVDIDCPLLTPKEKLHLDSFVKEGNICDDPNNKIGLDEEYIKNYGKFYKYYPQFFESIY